MPEGSETVRGYDFNNGLDYHELLRSYKRSGFQALNFGKAVEEINKMVQLIHFCLSYSKRDLAGQTDRHNFNLFVELTTYKEFQHLNKWMLV